MGVPVEINTRVAVDELDESHIALNQTAGNHALPAEALRVAALQAVKLVSGVGFLREVEGLGCGGLHARGGLKGLNTGAQVRVVLATLEVLAIEKLKQAEFVALLIGGGGAAMHVGDRFVAGNDARALMHDGQKVRAPHLLAGIRQPGRDDHERRQVGVVRAEPVADPRANARALEGIRPAVQTDGGAKVIVVDVLHRSDQADVIHHAADLREKIAHLRAALAVFFETPIGRLIKAFALLHGLIVVSGEIRLGIKRVHVADAAIHEHEDHALGLGREVRLLGRERIVLRRQHLR